MKKLHEKVELNALLCIIFGFLLTLLVISIVPLLVCFAEDIDEYGKCFNESVLKYPWWYVGIVLGVVISVGILRKRK